VKSGAFEIEVGGTRHAARASLGPMYDPKGERLRG
jgi:4-methylaminobutanoate oxidase (formaldehyde-forming)